MLLIIILSMVTYLTYKCTLTRSSWRYLQIFCIMGAILSYMLIAVHWVSESNLMALSVAFREIGKTFAPRLVYAIGFALLALLVLSQFSYQRVSASNSAERLAIVTVTMISAWSSTVLILLGRQGPFVALICIAGAWCVVKSQKPAAWMDNTNRTFPGLFIDPISMTQWSLLSICLFFYTGRWCTFDGLRLQVLFDHQSAIRMSGMSEKAYMRSFNAMHNGIGVRAKLDVRELAIQFGCVRLVSFVQKGLSLYKDRFLAALPASQRANTDFNRPVFAAVAFYLCAKRHKVGHN